MPIEYFLKEIKFSNGGSLKLKKDSFIVIVGPNNCGKSSLLNEINNFVGSGHNFKNLVVGKGFIFEKKGSEEDFKGFLKNSTQKIVRTGDELLLGYQLQIRESDAANCWNRPVDEGLAGVSPMFCFFANTAGRLDVCNPPTSINFMNDHPTHPIHLLKKKDLIAHKFNKYRKQAFGKELIVNHGAGNIIPLHIGTTPELSPEEDRVSETYLEKLQKLPTLEQQGDGIKSFVGCLLSTMVMQRSITLIDEPEAFLHPPQAKLIGKMLAAEHRDGSQIFLATHSIEVLKGILESQPKDLMIIRLTRENDTNAFHRLDSAQIKSVWADPVLRFSNGLDGIFHEGVVICEDDSDCRFYSTISTALAEEKVKRTSEEKNPFVKMPDYLFIPTGGLSRISKLITALKDLNIPIKVITDFDILAEETMFKDIFEKLGGDWNEISGEYSSLKDSVSLQPAIANKDIILDEISSCIDELKNKYNGSDFPKPFKEKIRGALKKDNPWCCAKRFGKEAFLQRVGIDALEKILSLSKKVGFWIVPWGPLESFDYSTEGRKLKWVANILQKDVIQDPSFEKARQFIGDAIFGNENFIEKGTAPGAEQPLEQKT